MNVNVGSGKSTNKLALLRQRRFWPLFWTQFLGAFNDQIYKNAFIALLAFRVATEQNYSSDTLSLYISIAAALYVLPFFLIAPTAGIISDQTDKSRMMRWVKLGEIIIMLGAVIAYSTQNVVLLFTILFLMGAQSAVFSPIKYGILPQYLSKRDLVTGNGIVQAGTFLAILLGTIVGTQVILTTYGIALTCVLVVGIAAIGYVTSLYAPVAPAVSNTKQEIDWNIFRTIFKMFRSIKAYPIVLRAVLATSWFWFVGATYLTLLPVYVKDYLNASEDVMTVLLSAFSVGVAIGALLCARLTRGQITNKYVPLGALGIAIFGTHLALADLQTLSDISTFFGTPLGLRIFFDFIGLSLCGGLYVTPLNVTMQHYAPHDKKGQVIACSNVMDSIGMVFASLLIIAFKSTGISVPHIMGVVAITGIGISLYTYLRL